MTDYNNKSNTELEIESLADFEQTDRDQLARDERDAVDYVLAGNVLSYA